ncbi:hydroxymethylglutaryl-CoA lyase [Rhodococcus koreensis]|uniref:Hydroxymethylglutaryl-CoA lyase n=1 Tax=Rhodococcus koreensis TaxID=99653 RepID=A0A1H4RPF7_9NOCA|nr:hydroxymethylglutaryl-CoA lyase [Rhodococcus koreensis]SEC33727.1 hydroxymethylglutaryl-CoA lyase [Rhodococcus koreensis]
MTTPANPEPVWRPAPHAFADPSLPSAVRIYEVGPRDGLQAESALVPTAVKAEFCRRLVSAGVRSLEVTSFVSPKWIPQLADAESLMAELDPPDDVRQVVLVPNERGLGRALAAGAREIAVFVSTTETFARKNLNTSVARALDNARPVVAGARAEGIGTRGYISMCFGDPWEGRVDPGRVADIAAELAGMGCTSISLGDTIGVATPGHVRAVLDAVVAAGVPVDSIAGHFHDTYGQALANVHAALIAGVTEFDTAAGGLGRCPYAKGTTGNLATEDLVWMLHGLGIHTGIDLDTLTDTSRWMAGHIGHPSPSRVATALTAALS